MSSRPDRRAVGKANLHGLVHVPFAAFARPLVDHGARITVDHSSSTHGSPQTDLGAGLSQTEHGDKQQARAARRVTPDPRQKPLSPEVTTRATGGRRLSDGARPALGGSLRFNHAGAHPRVCGRDVELPLRVRSVRRDSAAAEVCAVLVDPLQRHVKAACKLLGRGPFLAGPECQRVAQFPVGALRASAASGARLIVRHAARVRRSSRSTPARRPPPSDRAIGDGCDLELEPSQAIASGKCRCVPGGRCGGAALHTGVLLSLTVTALDQR